MKSALGIVVAFVCLLWAPGASAQVAELLLQDPDVVRFHASTTARDTRMPTYALQNDFPDIGPAPAGFPLSVNFSASGDRKVAEIFAPAGTDFYGTGMVSDQLLRNGKFISCWNDDIYGYTQANNQLYQSHPYVLGVRPDGTAFGALADTTFRCDVDLTQPNRIRFAAQGPEYPVIIIDADSPQEVSEALAELTGNVPMPPRWALGWQQSKWSYMNEPHARWVLDQYRNRSLPLDVVWFDIDYMFGFRVFTFDSADYPDVPGLDAYYESRSAKTVWMINPGVKQSAGFNIYDTGNALSVPAGGNAWVQDQFGNPYTGTVWPGASVYPDFTNDTVRNWWAGLYPSFMANGIDGVWNDMNEPVDFNGPARTIPENGRHRPEAKYWNNSWNTHQRFHNVYGMLMARATRQGIQDANPDKRPFVLSRANYIGGHRYAAAWTGDNTGDWNHLWMGTPMILNLSLSGQSFAGADIGGFIPTGQGGDHYARWVGIGAFYPFARAHYSGQSVDLEPWVYGQGTEDSVRRALERRYRLMPYLYTVFEESSRTGLPFMRPVFFADPADQRLRDEDHSFLIGEHLLVSPHTSPDRNLIVVLPNDQHGDNSWTKFHFGDANSGDATDPALPEMYLRSGSIIPSTVVRQSTLDMLPTDPITLIIALDDDGQAAGTLYEDDNDGYDYQSGDFLLTTYTAQRTGDAVEVSVASTQGSRARPSRSLNVRLLLGNGVEATGTGTDGSTVTVTIPADDDIVDSADGIVTDGFRESAWATVADATTAQSNPTNLGDNNAELNQLSVNTHDLGVHVMVTGNLPVGGFGFALFVDSLPGGQNQLNTAAVPDPPAGISDLNATRFDTGFEPDRLLWVNAFNAFYFVDAVDLPSASDATKTYRGQGTINDHNGLLVGGSNPNGLQVAFDNTNTQGVTATLAANAGAATNGFEMFIPWADLGLSQPDDCTTIKLAAAIVGADGTVSSQWLPGVPPGTGSLGIAPDMSAISGDQFMSVDCPADEVCLGDWNGDGTFAVGDILDFLAAWAAANDPRADINNDSVYAVGDVLDFLGLWASQCM